MAMVDGNRFKSRLGSCRSGGHGDIERRKSVYQRRLRMGERGRDVRVLSYGRERRRRRTRHRQISRRGRIGERRTTWRRRILAVERGRRAVASHDDGARTGQWITASAKKMDNEVGRRMKNRGEKRNSSQVSFFLFLIFFFSTRSSELISKKRKNRENGNGMGLYSAAKDVVYSTVWRWR